MSAFFGLKGQIQIAYSMLRYMKALPYQFGLATISGFLEHSHITGLRTMPNQLVNIYMIAASQVHPRCAKVLQVCPKLC